MVFKIIYGGHQTAINRLCRKLKCVMVMYSGAMRFDADCSDIQALMRSGNGKFFAFHKLLIMYFRIHRHIAFAAIDRYRLNRNIVFLGFTDNISIVFAAFERFLRSVGGAH